MRNPLILHGRVYCDTCKCGFETPVTTYIAVLINNPQKDDYCALAMPGRERARVILTNNNGINSNNRFANNLGFIKDEPLAARAQVLKLYEGDEV
ncbi:hypothetical protein IFM89_021875 [Coptis chinensis]|uniref:Uncharacterized protein n=1 Tax=Coptis chinensis TaxID=261450 RepID=A0A835LK35_9MAGN|nr:hypothetical protein IFM89_021875 [Coptis chinensis]